MSVDYEKEFLADLDQISQLIETPNLIRSLAVTKLRALDQTSMTISNRQKTANAISVLENIRDSSIRGKYEIIYNQVCVLAASSLEATLKKYFVNAANNYKNLKLDNPKLENIKINLRTVIERELKLGNTIGDTIVQSDNSLKFQDLQSIRRAFEEYFGKEITLESDLEKQIIFYLEARHVIVHKGGIVDKKFVNTTKSRGANLKSLKEGDHIQLAAGDWRSISTVYPVLVSQLTRH